MPKVATKKISVRSNSRSGRARTYLIASRNWPLARGTRSARYRSAGRISFRLTSTAP